LLEGIPMISSNDKDCNCAGLARQASALALTTCSLADLAAAVRRAVVAIGHDANERYGARKVFLAAVHAALGGECAIELEAFKRRMVTAHRAGLLVLARADLVAAMPRGACQRSLRRLRGVPLPARRCGARPVGRGPCESRALAGRAVAMRRLPPGTSFDVIGEVDHLRYQIARADALLHAANDLLERVGAGLSPDQGYWRGDDATAP
jgi:hypothetical protein